MVTRMFSEFLYFAFLDPSFVFGEKPAINWAIWKNSSCYVSLSSCYVSLSSCYVSLPTIHTVWLLLRFSTCYDINLYFTITFVAKTKKEHLYISIENKPFLVLFIFTAFIKSFQYLNFSVRVVGNHVDH